MNSQSWAPFILPTVSTKEGRSIDGSMEVYLGESKEKEASCDCTRSYLDRKAALEVFSETD